MRRVSHLTGAVLFGAFGLTSSALAQPPPPMALTPACHSHADLAAMLNQKYSEAPNAVGVQANGHLVEVFASNDGTSWTIVVTRPDGVSCIVAVGEDWETLPNPISRPLA
jgi:hypothetical protein